jgi:hypothetical protein
MKEVKNISVITNFGCRADCWYCIWKGHSLEHVNEPTDWVKLEKFLTDNKDKGKVSVSGGGDSLYKYEKHKDWWDKFFEVTEKLGMKVDVHTREKFLDDVFWSRINRCSFSSDNLSQDFVFLLSLSMRTKMRITHLVTANTTFGMIEDYLEFQKFSGCQFTIKQLVGHDDGGMYQKVREKYPQIYCLDEGDYNIYYMPDNSIREAFLEKHSDNA